MENWILWIRNLISLVVGAVLTFIITSSRDRKKNRKEEEERRTKEIEILISLSLEIKKGIERSKYYVRLSEGSPPKKSFSKIYTPFWNVWIRDFMKISKDYNVVRRLHDIYEIFFFINFNIDSGNYSATIGYAKEYIPSMDENYNNILRAIKNKADKSNNKEEFIKEINNLGEMKDDSNDR